MFIIPTLFRDYNLYYFISISSHFSAVLALFFFVLFSLSSLVLQNMLQLQKKNNSRWLVPCFIQEKSPAIRAVPIKQEKIKNPDFQGRVRRDFGHAVSLCINKFSGINPVPSQQFRFSADICRKTCPAHLHSFHSSQENARQTIFLWHCPHKSSQTVFPTQQYVFQPVSAAFSVPVSFHHFLFLAVLHNCTEVIFIVENIADDSFHVHPHHILQNDCTDVVGFAFFIVLTMSESKFIMPCEVLSNVDNLIIRLWLICSF